MALVKLSETIDQYMTLIVCLLTRGLGGAYAISNVAPNAHARGMFNLKTCLSEVLTPSIGACTLNIQIYAKGSSDLLTRSLRCIV